MERLAPRASSPPSSTTASGTPMDTLRDKNQLETLWDVGPGALEDVV